jgi:uncharacterized protein YjbI with pentapeptide repeats
MARTPRIVSADKRAVGSDRPVDPRTVASLDVIDLSSITTGEWDRVELTGALPADFDEPLLLTEVTLRGANLVGARLHGSRWVDVVVEGSDLSAADFYDSSFTRVSVTDARLSGAQLSQMRLRDVRFVDCRLDDVNLAMSVAERVRFERCRMAGADLRAARCEGIAWWDCDLTDAEVSQIRVDRAQLHGSTIQGLRGAADLAPLHIDADQFVAFAEHLLAAKGIVVEGRID